MVKGEKGTLILLVLYYISYYNNNNTKIYKMDKIEIKVIITLFSIYLFCFMIEQGYI